MSRRTSKQAISIVVFVITVFIAVGQQQGWFGTITDSVTKGVETNQPGLYAIDHFVDGDTIAVNMNGAVESVRFIGVDTPETHKPNTPVQCYGPAAAAFTKNLIGANKVRLASDSLNTDRDRYNRLLRYVYLPDGRMVQTELLQGGYAFAYVSFPFSKSDEFSALQKAAMEAKKGLWGNCTPVLQSNGRWQSNTQG